jgi:hypothetical protein
MWSIPRISVVKATKFCGQNLELRVVKTPKKARSKPRYKSQLIHSFLLDCNCG